MRTFFLFINLILSTTLFSQKITDFFVELPDSSILDLTKEQRRAIVKQSLEYKSYNEALKNLSNRNIYYAISELDIPNGYLKLMGAFEGHLQMCYWNIKNGNKLIAVYQEGCGPVCYVENFEFYIYNGKTYQPVAIKSILPDYEQDFIKGNFYKTKQKMEKDDVIASYLFDLPRKGKNIVVKYGNENSNEVYKRYGIVGNRMILVWDDGKFKKGKMYWVGN